MPLLDGRGRRWNCQESPHCLLQKRPVVALGQSTRREHGQERVPCLWWVVWVKERLGIVEVIEHGRAIGMGGTRRVGRGQT